MNHALLRGKQFDVCIIDEAGQVGRLATCGACCPARPACLRLLEKGYGWLVAPTPRRPIPRLPAPAPAPPRR